MAFVGASLAIGLGTAATTGATIGGVAASTVLGAGALGLSALGTGLSMSGALDPSAPNYSASSRKQADAQASLLPYQQLTQAQAQLGLQAPPTPENQIKIDKYNAQIKQLQELGGSENQISKLQAKIAKLTPPSMAGYGTADIQKQIMNQQAAQQLAQAQKYDSQYIEEAKKQQALADPESGQARKAMYDLIQKQILNPPTSPVADQMESRVASKVAAGSGLTPEEQAMLDKSVMQMQSITGTKGATPNYSADMTTGMQGTQRGIQNAMTGAQWLGSGLTPADIEYRSTQQNMANLSNFMAGQTPQSQFRQLSAAQQGPTPNYQDTALPGMNMNAGQQGAQAALTQYGQQVNTPNPWATGLSAGVGLAGSAVPLFK